MTLNRFNTTLAVYNGFIWHTNESRDMQSNLYKKKLQYIRMPNPKLIEEKIMQKLQKMYEKICNKAKISKLLRNDERCL